MNLLKRKNIQTIQRSTKEIISADEMFLVGIDLSSPRTVGDAVQKLLAHNAKAIFGDYAEDFITGTSAKALADFSFVDKENNLHSIDVKTHRTSTKFNMPNLVSVERLSTYYKDVANYFDVLLVSYDVVDGKLTVSDVKFSPIESISWECLTIGALGWGQIQLKSSNNVVPVSRNRRRWMREFCFKTRDFYIKEIKKIQEIRLKHFYLLEKEYTL